uniref:Uncharacterized protein n=1 Tax=Leishmania guyanensis TaxID=5670 RepID=A0A1E1J963_LEIGU|nr:Hypothetical protein BN36_NA76460 [Leishmania guyanensis]CCM43473.1 Hypothetical protein BN36_NA76800 [Leishmania guyanensis]
MERRLREGGQCGPVTSAVLHEGGAKTNGASRRGSWVLEKPCRFSGILYSTPPFHTHITCTCDPCLSSLVTPDRTHTHTHRERRIDI